MNGDSVMNLIFSEEAKKTPKTTRSSSKKLGRKRQNSGIMIYSQSSSNSNCDTSISSKKKQSFDFYCPEKFSLKDDSLSNSFNNSNMNENSFWSFKDIEIKDEKKKTLHSLDGYLDEIAPFKNYSKYNLQCNLFQDENNYSNERDIYMLMNHPDLNIHMRALLLQWIIDVSTQFGFKRNTYYLCVSIIDRYLSCTVSLLTSQFQLLGVTALMIAAKFEVIKLSIYFH